MPKATDLPYVRKKDDGGGMFEYLGSIGPFQLVGVVGFVVYIFAFGRVQFGLLDGNSATYSALNVIAASLVSISLFVEFNLSSALIQGSWVFIGLVGIIRRRSGRPGQSTQNQCSPDAQEAA